MFFYASKILGFFAIPSNLVIVIGIVGALLLRTRFVRTGWRLAVGSLVLLAVIGLSPVGNALIVPLEQRFPPYDHGRGAPHGIVVLGGAVTPDVSYARNDVALNEAAERMTAVVELARRYPDARIIFSGGSAALVFDETPEAVIALRLFESLGIAAGPRHRRGQVAQHGGERAVLQGDRRSPSRASVGCWSPPPIICRARSACSARPAFRSRAIRSTGAPAAPATRCGRSRPWAMGCAAPTPPCANGWGLLVYWLTGTHVGAFPRAGRGAVVATGPAPTTARHNWLFSEPVREIVTD